MEFHPKSILSTLLAYRLLEFLIVVLSVDKKSVMTTNRCNDSGFYK